MAPTKELTDKEHGLILNAWKSLKVFPEMDWDKFARLCGYTNPASGRNAMTAIRKKLDAQAEADGEQAFPGLSKAKAKAPGKRKNADVEGGGDEAAPAKAKKRAPTKSDKVAPEEEQGEDGEDAPAQAASSKTAKHGPKKPGQETIMEDNEDGVA